MNVTAKTAKQRVKSAQHIFDPPLVLPVAITNNRARPFKFTRNFRYRVRQGNHTILDIRIEPGFECDLGSFPWWIRWVPGLTQAGPHVRGLAIHDALYRYQPLDKITCDMIARHVLEIDGCPLWMRIVIIGGVLIGGRHAWMENLRALEDAGEGE